MGRHAIQIALASGKGSTGKTTLATNLAYVAAYRGHRVAYLDCDVGNPHGNIFLRPTITQRTPVAASLPCVGRESCDLCSRCNELCRMVCPLDAITKTSHGVGMVETGSAGSIEFAQGLFAAGRPRAAPIIQAVKSVRVNANLVILDAPAGTSCQFVETVRGVDFVVLVTEPTPPAFQELKLAIETMQTLGLRSGVVINRAGPDGTGAGYQQCWLSPPGEPGGAMRCDPATQPRISEIGRKTRAYCRVRQIPILAEIPDDLRFAQASAGGLMAAGVCADLVPLFEQLLGAIRGRMQTQTPVLGDT